MSRLEAAAVLAVVVVATWVVATALPAWSEVAWATGIFVILATALGVLTARATAMLHPGPSPFGTLLEERDPVPVRPADLERIERLSGWVAYSQHDFGHRLKPVLSELIRRRLSISKGIELQDGGLLPPELLPPELAALLEPADKSGPPVTTEDLNRALDDIETL